jgi:hypothetical protein
MEESFETEIIEIKLDEDSRKKLNTQALIEEESKYPIKEMDYTKFIETFQDETKLNLTKMLLDKLFQNHNDFKKIKNKLLISTFRTIYTDKASGIGGETFPHIDNLDFPGHKDSNLLITWGLGTQAATLKTTDFLTKTMNILLEEAEKSGDYTKTDLFSDLLFSMFDNPVFFEDESDTVRHREELIHLIANIPNKQDESLLDDFKKIVLMKYDEILGSISTKKFMESKAPNNTNNISAIIISGKYVYHRRSPPKEGASPSWRYALNIYFNRNDLHLPPPLQPPTRADTRIPESTKRLGGRKTKKKTIKNKRIKKNKKTNRKKYSII